MFNTIGATDLCFPSGRCLPARKGGGADRRGVDLLE